MKILAFILLLLVVFKLSSCGEEQPPPTAEESFIGEQVKVLRKAENYEQEYLDAVGERQKRIEQQVEEDSG